jgi:hypothetical protein
MKLYISSIDILHKLIIRKLSLFKDQLVDKDIVRKLAIDFINLLPSNDDISIENLKKTLLQYEGFRLSSLFIVRLSRQLAANIGRLSNHIIQAYTSQISVAGVAVEILDVREIASDDNTNKSLLTLYCLTGNPAGTTVQTTVSDKYLAYLAYEVLGFNRILEYSNSHKETVIGLRAIIDIVCDTQNNVLIENWQEHKELKDHNYRILCKRLRLDIEDKGKPNSPRQRALEIATCDFDLTHYCSKCTHHSGECIAAPVRLLHGDRLITLDGSTRKV